MCSRILALGLLVLLAGCQQESSDVPFGTLTELADSYETDKGTAHHQFTKAYELYFHPIRKDVRKVFEIGVLRGASLKMMHEYFPEALIIGADIVPKKALENDRIKTLIADQSKRTHLNRLIRAHGTDYDIIIDDGGHSMEQQQVSFGFLFPHVRPGGYYVIEDVHTSLVHPHYGVNESGSNTSLTMAEKYGRTRKVESEYMTAEEMAYATEHIDFAHLHVGNQGRSLAWILRKRAE